MVITELFSQEKQRLLYTCIVSLLGSEYILYSSVLDATHIIILDDLGLGRIVL